MDPIAQIRKKSLAESAIVSRAVLDSFRKLDPRTMVKNPVMFVVEVGAVLTTIQLVWNVSHHDGQFGFGLQITLWLWFTVLFANFAEAMAEGRGKAQADTLRKARAETQAHRLRSDGNTECVASSKLRSGDIVVVAAGDFIPGDGEVIEGVASVDESAITGESAPVIRESGGDRSAVTGGTRVISDWIKVRITSDPGHTFLDRMIALVEGSHHYLVAGSRHAAAFRDLFRRAAEHLRAGFTPGVSDTNDHWRIALRDRHCGHGPAHSEKRNRDVRSCRRSVRRRGRTLARQNRHDHARQSRRHAVLPSTRD